MLKFEIRISKSETISNDRNSNDPNKVVQRNHNTDKPEPKKEINHESTKGPQYDSTYLGAGEDTKKI